MAQSRCTEKEIVGMGGERKTLYETQCIRSHSLVRCNVNSSAYYKVTIASQSSSRSHVCAVWLSHNKFGELSVNVLPKTVVHIINFSIHSIKICLQQFQEYKSVRRLNQRRIIFHTITILVYFQKQHFKNKSILIKFISIFGYTKIRTLLLKASDDLHR